MSLRWFQLRERVPKPFLFFKPKMSAAAANSTTWPAKLSLCQTCVYYIHVQVSFDISDVSVTFGIHTLSLSACVPFFVQLLPNKPSTGPQGRLHRRPASLPGALMCQLVGKPTGVPVYPAKLYLEYRYVFFLNLMRDARGKETVLRLVRSCP